METNVVKPALLMPIAALIALSACGQSTENAASGPEMSSEDVARTMDSVKLEAGQWEATQEILDVSISGTEGVSADAFKRLIGQVNTITHCVTPEQAANPSADLLAAQDQADCTYADMAMSGGKVSANMTCTSREMEQGTMKIAMNGAYLPASYDITMDVETIGLPGGRTMTMKMKTSGKRIGECGDDAAGNGAG